MHITAHLTNYIANTEVNAERICLYNSHRPRLDRPKCVIVKFAEIDFKPIA